MSGLTWLDNLVDLDFEGLQDQITKSVEEASRIIDEVNSLEILNLDALAAKQEQEHEEEDNDESDDDDEIEIVHEYDQHPRVNHENLPKFYVDISTGHETESNINSIVTKVTKLDKTELEWSDDFLESESSELTLSVDVPQAYNKESFVGENIVSSISDPSDSVIHFAHVDQDETYSAPIDLRGAWNDNADIPHRDSRISGSSNVPNEGVDTEPYQKKRKGKKKKRKKKHDKGGLDFWGFSSQETENDEDNNNSNQFESGYINQDDANNNNISGIEEAFETANSFPQQIVGFISSTIPSMSYSFFDNIEEEIDLEEDPVIKSVKDNINRPKESRNFLANSALTSLSNTFNQSWNAITSESEKPTTSSSQDSSLADNESSHHGQGLMKRVGTVLLLLFGYCKTSLSFISYQLINSTTSTSLRQSASNFVLDLRRPEVIKNNLNEVSSWRSVYSCFVRHVGAPSED
jgi:hypothetical protein